MDIFKEQTKRSSWEYFLLRAAREISLSEVQYETIDNRYAQLQKILSASDNPLLAEAHIFVQGSMRLKTTIKPVSDAPEDLNTIDADAIVWLPNAKGASADEVLEIIEARFREGSRVQEEIQPLRRGIRIVYSDEKPGFHIDVTPARAVNGNGEEKGEGKLEVPDRVVGWKPSSPIPYSNWLDVASREQITLENYLAVAKGQRTFDAATQDPLPDYRSYADQDALRAAIKLLKRHRDEWAIRTGNEKGRPISAVITTLATHAYLGVVSESRSQPLRPLDAIIEIVRRMPNHIDYQNGHYNVLNPMDHGENFAEKWNRPDEGHLYCQAFTDWHTSAASSISLGLESYDSAVFTSAVNESFGMGPTFITSVNNEIPANWTMPGRPEGTSRNTTSMGALFGGTSAGGKSQAAVKPVNRLG